MSVLYVPTMVNRVSTNYAGRCSQHGSLRPGACSSISRRIPPTRGHETFGRASFRYCNLPVASLYFPLWL